MGGVCRSLLEDINVETAQPPAEANVSKDKHKQLLLAWNKQDADEQLHPADVQTDLLWQQLEASQLNPSRAATPRPTQTRLKPDKVAQHDEGVEPPHPL